jgi:glutamate dehydrogenase/leucine dehydrogenase
MRGKMKIGIIGTGNIGSALTRHFTRLGHDVVVARQDPNGNPSGVPPPTVLGHTPRPNEIRQHTE